MPYQKLSILLVILQLSITSYAGPLYKMHCRPFVRTYAAKIFQRPVTLSCEPRGTKPSVQLFMLVSAGATLDAYSKKMRDRAQLLVVETKLKTGFIPPLTLENISRYPEHKHAYITYTLAHHASMNMLVVGEVFRKYGKEITKELVKKSCPEILDQLKNYIDKSL